MDVGNDGSVIIEFVVIEIMGFAVSMESLSVFSFWHQRMQEYFFQKMQISISGLGRHIATTPTNSIKTSIPEVTAGIPLGI